MTVLSNIKACVFDAYGTLFDVHSAVGRHRTRLGSEADRVSALWRSKQLEYTWLRSLMQRHADFWQVTGDALDYALDSFDINDAALRRDLMQAYLRLSCYEEVPEVLSTLKRHGMQTAILSNGSPQMLQAGVDNAGLGDHLDQVLSVEDVGIFKPDPRVYQLAVDTLGVAAQQISFQSSNAWDAVAAASFGFRVVWINRFGQRRERLSHQPDVELKTLHELPRIVGAGD
jgi:2-haloacid dehalogenase